MLALQHDDLGARSPRIRRPAVACPPRAWVLEMPHTGLRAYTPVAAFTRPSGHGCERGVIPDVAIDDDGLDPDRAPALLAREIAAALDRPGTPR